MTLGPSQNMAPPPLLPSRTPLSPPDCSSAVSEDIQSTSLVFFWGRVGSSFFGCGGRCVWGGGWGDVMLYYPQTHPTSFQVHSLVRTSFVSYSDIHSGRPLHSIAINGGDTQKPHTDALSSSSSFLLVSFFFHYKLVFRYNALPMEAARAPQ